MSTPQNAAKERSVDRSSAHQPIYRDAQLGALLKDLRAVCGSHLHIKVVLDKVEKRLRRTLGVIESWDASWTEKAELLIRLGNLPATISATQIIFDAHLRRRLLSRCLIGGDTSAIKRLAEAAELDREVLV